MPLITRRNPQASPVTVLSDNKVMSQVITSAEETQRRSACESPRVKNLLCIFPSYDGQYRKI